MLHNANAALLSHSFIRDAKVVSTMMSHFTVNDINVAHNNIVTLWRFYDRLWWAHWIDKNDVITHIMIIYDRAYPCGALTCRPLLMNSPKLHLFVCPNVVTTRLTKAWEGKERLVRLELPTKFIKRCRNQANIGLRKMSVCLSVYGGSWQARLAISKLED
jgi:hypothetical protein